jgi:hypothetical protein
MKNLIFLYAPIILIAAMPSITTTRSGDPVPGAEEHFQGSNILLIVGDENGKSEPGNGIGDVFIRNRLEKVMGHKVFLGIDSSPSDELYVAAVEADLVIVSESTTSRKLQDKLKSVITPVINYESFIQDEMGLTAKEPSGDPGEPEDYAYGVRNKDTSIDIIMPNHPLAAGLKGNVQVYQEPKQITWGKVGKGAKVIATLTGEKSAAVIYIYDKCAKLFDGTTAAGMRIGIFLEDDDETGTANLMTEDGLRLFDAAVLFALESENVN